MKYPRIRLVSFLFRTVCAPLLKMTPSWHRVKSENVCACVCVSVCSSEWKWNKILAGFQDLPGSFMFRFPFNLFKIIPPGSPTFYFRHAYFSSVLQMCRVLSYPKPLSIVQNRFPGTAQAGSSPPSGLSSAQCSFPSDPKERALYLPYKPLIKLSLFVFLHIAYLPNEKVSSMMQGPYSYSSQMYAQSLNNN